MSVQPKEVHVAYIIEWRNSLGKLMESGPLTQKSIARELMRDLEVRGNTELRLLCRRVTEEEVLE
jgi:ParB-like chromosome segregation protein Spo0J